MDQLEWGSGLASDAEQARVALTLAAQGDLSSVNALLSDPLKLRLAINQAIGRLEGEGALIASTAPPEPDGSYKLKRFDERGLPEMDAESLRKWAVAMLSAGQERPLKHDLSQLEMAILKGDAILVAQTLERSPMAPWVMDFSLRQYEAENLLCFASKYAPAPGDFAIIDALLSCGLSLPARGAFTRLEAPALAKAMPGCQSKGVERVGECLERSGWVFEFADYVMLFARARDERDPMAGAGAGAEGRPKTLIDKIEFARWMAKKDVSPLGRLSCERDAGVWRDLVTPNQWSALSARSERLKSLGMATDFGLEEVFASESASLRQAEQWAYLGPWLLESGLDVEKISRLAIDNGLSMTAALILPWAESFAIERACQKAELIESHAPTRL